MYLTISILGLFYRPSEHLTVDEQLVGFRGRCPFKQYNQSKPARFGFLIYWLTDWNGFPLRGIPYLGKDHSRPKGVSLGEHMVTSLASPYYGFARNITCDNFFTSLPLGDRLRTESLTIVGTVRKNKAFIPKQFLTKRQVGSSVYGYQQTATLLSFQCKPTKSVIMYSTLHLGSQESEDNSLPEIVSFYNKTKCGVDVMDQMVHSYTTKRQSKRWPVAFFANMIDVGLVAAFKLFTMNNEDTGMSRLDFLDKVSSSLVLPYAIERAEKKRGRHIAISLATQQFLRLSTANEEKKEDNIYQEQGNKRTSQGPATRSRCEYCKSSKGKMTKTQCSQCQVHVCKDHSTVSCLNCQGDNIETRSE